MNPQRPIWQSALTPAERGRGWVFFALYVFLFPPLMGLIQRAMGGELPVAEANVIYYLLCVTLVLLVLWNFLKKSGIQVPTAPEMTIARTRERPIQADTA